MSTLGMWLIASIIALAWPHIAQSDTTVSDNLTLTKITGIPQALFFVLTLFENQSVLSLHVQFWDELSLLQMQVHFDCGTVLPVQTTVIV